MTTKVEKQQELTVESINAMMAELKEKQKQLKLMAEEMKAKAKVESEELKKEAARLRAEQMKSMLGSEPKVNKSEQIRKLMAEGKTRDEIAEALGYSPKFVTDNMWRIEKSLGLR